MSEVAGRARGVDRVLEILDCLHVAKEPLRIGEIARRLGAPRSSVYELVGRLTEAGILENHDADGRVFFGRTLHFYAVDYLAANGLSRLARDEVVRLAGETGETAEYCSLHGNKYTVVHMQPGRKVFRLTSEIGVAVPIPWTASGRLLLGHMTRKDIEAFVPAEDFVLPDGTRLDPGEFCKDAHRARQDGFSVTFGLIDGVTQCLAVPVLDSAGIARACVCFVLMERRDDAETARLLDILRESARRLSSHQAPLP